MRLSILIVHYKTPEPLAHCLQSIFAQNFKDFEVIVVDNENNPALLNIIAPYKNQVTLVQNQDNIGYGRANNQAAKLAQGQYLFLLNPDAILLQQDDLSRLLAFADAHSQYGIIGVKVLDQKQQESTPPRHVYPGLKRYRGPLFKDFPGEIAWVLGAGMLIRKTVFDQVHGFDPDFFLYGDEADLCLRIRKAGMPIGYCSEVAIEHIGGASERTITEYEYWLKKQRGLYLFYTKHYPEKLWRKLLKKDLLRANYRLFVLFFEQKFNNTKTIRMKCERNQAIKDSIIKTLHDPRWLQYFN